MRVNERDTRLVRTYAYDLAVGDVVVEKDGEYEGTVDSVPQTTPDGYVEFWISAEMGTLKRRWADTRVVRIEIARRLS